MALGLGFRVYGFFSRHLDDSYKGTSGILTEILGELVEHTCNMILGGFVSQSLTPLRLTDVRERGSCGHSDRNKRVSVADDTIP